MADSESKSRLRFRLRELFLLVAVICLGVGFFVTSKRLRSLESEVKLIREEVGHLTIDDPTQVHVLALDVDEPNTWRWRMFLPKGNRYKWKGGCASIPLEGVPNPGPGLSTTGISNEPYWNSDNEVLVTASLRQTESGDWTLRVSSKIAGSRHQMYGFTLRIAAEEMERFHTGSTQGSQLGSRGQVVIDPKGPIFLLRQRGLTLTPDEQSEELLPGYAIWLEKQ